MKTTLNWTQKMTFAADADGNSFMMDAKSPIGDGKAATPKELIVAGLGGCTAMDVIALLKKHKQDHKTFQVDVDVTSSTGVHPAVFTDAYLQYRVTGVVEKAILLDAVKLSQTKFCGVSAMLSKAFPIRYDVFLNDEKIGSGQADFTA